MAEPQVYLNGQLLPASQARINIYDLGLVMGATVSEVARTFNHRLYRLDDHLARLSRSLRYAGFDTGLGNDELARVCEELTTTNAALLQPHEELELVIFVTAGESRIHAPSAAVDVRDAPTVCVHTFPLPFHLYAEKMHAGAHVVTPSVRHVPPQCYDPKMKCRSRMHYYLADREARLVDPQAMALLLDLDGNIAEASAANFLIAEKDAIVSPIACNTLSGVSRMKVVELAAALQIPFTERDLQAFDVANADEAFLTSTPYCIMPVTKINGLTIGTGKPGKIFHKLVEAWSRDVGLDIMAQFNGT